MPKLTLKVGEERPIATPKAFLNILKASAEFIVESEDIGVLAGKTNKHFEMGSYRNVFFTNNTDAPIDIEYEIANIRTTSSGESNVNVQNEITVKRIVEAIQVNASATVENGKMAINVNNASAVIAAAKRSIPVNTAVEVFLSKSALNRQVTIQLVTDNADMQEVYVAATRADAEAKAGIFLQGHKDVPAVYQQKTEMSVWVFNPSLTVAQTLSGNEDWRI